MSHFAALLCTVRVWVHPVADRWRSRERVLTIRGRHRRLQLHHRPRPTGRNQDLWTVGEHRPAVVGQFGLCSNSRPVIRSMFSRTAAGDVGTMGRQSEGVPR